MYTVDEILATPTIIIEETLNNFDTELNNGTIAREYTTPFHMLMESSRTLAKDSLLGSQSIIRRKIPSLATTSSDIYLHIHNDLKDNLFAIPGSAPIVFYVNVLDLKQYGVNENSSYKMSIPASSTVEVRGVTFTLLNDIEITLKDNGNITVEQINNTLDIAVNDIGILPSNLYTDVEGVEWIVFETNIKSITKSSYSLPIVISNNFRKNITLSKKYSTIYVNYNDGIEKSMDVSYSDEYLNDSKPTCVVGLSSNMVTVYIPDIYLLDRTVSGILNIDVYETEGNVYLPLNQLDLKEFVITLNNSGKTDYTAVSPNVTMYANSRGILNNGVDNMTFEELKTAVVNSTLGDIDLPITDLQIKRKAKMSGYELDLVKDTLFNRLYIASKSLPEPDSTLIHSKPDLFFNRTTIKLDSDMFNNFVNVYDDLFVIKNDAIFKYDDNGNIFLLDNTELEAFNLMSKANKIEYLKSYKLFYTPFTYVVKYDENLTSTEVYYLNPSMDNIRILNKNFNILQKVNTKQYEINKTSTGYQILSNIAYNDELLKTDMSKLKARLVFTLYGSTSKLYFDATYNPTTMLFEFNIETGYLYNNLINLENGISVLVDKAIELTTKAYIYIYSTDSVIVDSEKYLQSEFGKTTDSITILTKESITISFGKRLDYLYNSIYNLYTTKKYKTYTTNTPLVYTEDIYKTYDNGLKFQTDVSASGKVNLTTELLHKKGDIVYDENGDIVYKNKIGDIVYDNNNEPIIDLYSGITRILNIMMLEFEYKIAETESYKKYNKLVMDMVYNMVYEDMTNLNSITLESTIIKYRSFRSIESVTVDVNNVNYKLDYNIKPIVTLYINKENEITSSTIIEDYKSKCGKIISKHLNNNKIILRDIKDEIIALLGSNIKAISIVNLDPNSNEVINVIGNNRFTIDKKLEINEANLYTVKYNMELKIQYV